jgi:hypothetical protein
MISQRTKAPLQAAKARGAVLGGWKGVPMAEAALRRLAWLATTHSRLHLSWMRFCREQYAGTEVICDLRVRSNACDGGKPPQQSGSSIASSAPTPRASAAPRDAETSGRTVLLKHDGSKRAAFMPLSAV